MKWLDRALNGRGSSAVIASLLALASWPADASVANAIAPADPLFEANSGQFADAVSFRARFKEFDAAVMKDGSISIVGHESAANPITLRFQRTQQSMEVRGEHQTELRTNYFHGDKAFVDVPNYARVRVADIHPGIDLAYHAESGRLEYDLIVAPQGSIEGLRFAIEGAGHLSVDANGDLLIATKAGRPIVQRKPVAYQLDGDTRRAVAAAYRVADGGSVELVIGDRDRSRELVIDPVIEYSSYLGGSSNDMVRDIKIGPGGYIYLFGRTQSSNFPVVGALDSSLGGSEDIFVTKVDPFTGRAVYSTFIGGRNVEIAEALAVDANGNAYLTGAAGDQYPTTAGAYRTTFSAGAGFVTKLNAAGNGLAYSTFLPGATPLAITVDLQGRAVVTGAAGTGLTTTAGAYRTTFGGGGSDATHGDAFVLRLNAAGSAAEFSTFFGGSGVDEARGVAVDSAGNIVIGGITGSSNLPVSADAIQPSFNNTGYGDSFIAILNGSGNALVAGTYFGGSSSEEINGVAVDATGNILIAGYTNSQDFPITNAVIGFGDLVPEGLFQKGFAAKVARNPLRLVFSTFVGSKAMCCESAYSIAADAAGDVYVAGTASGARLDRFDAKHQFLPAALVLAKQGSSGSAVYAATGIKRDGSALLFNSLVAPAGGNAMKVVISAKDAGQFALAGNTYANWVPIAPANGQPANGSLGLSYYEVFAMSFGLDQVPLALDASVQQALTTSTVKLVATSASTPTGMVTFWDGQTSIGTASLTEGIGVLNTTLSAGVRRLKATVGAVQSAEVFLPVALPDGVCQ